MWNKYTLDGADLERKKEKVFIIEPLQVTLRGNVRERALHMCRGQECRTAGRVSHCSLQEDLKLQLITQQAICENRGDGVVAWAAMKDKEVREQRMQKAES